MDDPIADFMAITGCTDEAEAIGYLSKCDFDLGNAVAAYTAETHASTAPLAAPSSPTPPPPEPVQFSSLPSDSEAYNTNGMHTAYTQADRLGSDFDPGPQLGVAPRNPFEDATQQRLLDLFAYPEYVIRQTSSLETVCARAREVDRWVLVAIVDKNFQSACLPRDLWRDAQMKDLGEDYVACLEVNSETRYGAQVANEYRVNQQILPFLFIVNPITTSRAEDIVLDASRIDAKSVVSQILTFIADHGSPNAFVAAGQSAEDAAVPDTCSTQSHTVDVDAEEGGSAHNTASPPREPESTALSSAELAGMPDVSVVDPVSLDQYACDDTAVAFRLRVRLPLSTLTLALRPETPVVEVMRFAAYRMHLEESSTYPAPPPVQLRTAFPPRDVSVEDASVPVSAWPGVRSGDVLMVRVA